MREIQNEYDRELIFFFGLQIKQTRKWIFHNQSKYTREILKIFRMEKVKGIDTPMSSPCKFDQDESGKRLNLNSIEA